MSEFGDPRLPALFWRKVKITESDCWEWQASRDANGYGRFYQRPRHHITDLAHRRAYLSLVGEPVTHAENMRRGLSTLSACRKAGHPYPEHAGIDAKGYRYCKTCAQLRWDIQNARAKAARRTPVPVPVSQQPDYSNPELQR